MNLLDISLAYPGHQVDSINGIHVHRQNIYLTKKGCEIRVINPVMPHLYLRRCNYPFSSLKDGISVWRPRLFWIPRVFQVGRPYTDLFFSMSVMNVLPKVTANWQPDLVVCDWMLPGGISAARIAHFWKIPLVIKLHGLDMRAISAELNRSNNHRAFTHFSQIAKYAQLVICNGQGLYDGIIETGLFSADKIVKIPIGVDTDEFYPLNVQDRSKCRQSLNISNNSVVVAFVGSWRKEKGSEDIAEVMPILFEKYLSLHLLVVGPIRDRKSFNKLRKHKQVHFMGKVKPSHVASFLKISDIFLLPSYREGLPSALLEAMACGVVPIATRVGGIPAVIESGFNGFLLDPGCPNQLLEVLSSVIRNSHTIRNARLEALKTVQNQGYNLSSVASNLFEVLSSLPLNT